MNNAEQIIYLAQNKVQEERKIPPHIETIAETRNGVNSILNNGDVTQNLAEIFGMDNEGTKNELADLQNTNEVNGMEFDLAKIFGKEREMGLLNKRSLLTLASVNQAADNYYIEHAA